MGNQKLRIYVVGEQHWTDLGLRTADTARIEGKPKFLLCLRLMPPAARLGAFFLTDRSDGEESSPVRYFLPAAFPPLPRLGARAPADLIGGARRLTSLRGESKLRRQIRDARALLAMLPQQAGKVARQGCLFLRPHRQSS